VPTTLSRNVPRTLRAYRGVREARLPAPGARGRLVTGRVHPARARGGAGAGRAPCEPDGRGRDRRLRHRRDRGRRVRGRRPLDHQPRAPQRHRLAPRPESGCHWPLACWPSSTRCRDWPWPQGRCPRPGWPDGCRGSCWSSRSPRCSSWSCCFPMGACRRGAGARCCRRCSRSWRAGSRCSCRPARRSTAAWPRRWTRRGSATRTRWGSSPSRAGSTAC
jgi:hypothetical protein